MKKICLLWLCLATIQTNACDICGCSSGGYTLGLLPGSPQHFIGLGYKWRSFETTHLTLFEDEVAQRSVESYQTFECWGRFVPHKRFQFFGYLPYQTATQRGDHATKVAGLGDAIVSAFWSVPIQNDSICGMVDRRLLVGFSSKIPTGRNDMHSNQGVLINENLQAGSGSWDAIYHVSFTELHNRWGFMAEASYRRNSHNKNYFRFGNRINTSARLFARKQLKHDQGTIMPFGGIVFEKGGHDFDGHSLNEFSGGQLTMSQFGVDAVIKQVGIRTAISIPVQQELANNQIKAKTQFTVSILYLF